MSATIAEFAHITIAAARDVIADRVGWRRSDVEAWLRSRARREAVR